MCMCVYLQGIESVQAAAGALSSRAEDYSNDVRSYFLAWCHGSRRQHFFLSLFRSLKAGLEQVWALKAIKYAETHFKV